MKTITLNCVWKIFRDGELIELYLLGQCKGRIHYNPVNKKYYVPLANDGAAKNYNCTNGVKTLKQAKKLLINCLKDNDESLQKSGAI